MVNLKSGKFKEWLKEIDIELYENTKAISILHSCKKPINRTMFKKGELLLKGVGTLKRDLYKEEQNFLDNIEL